MQPGYYSHNFKHIQISVKNKKVGIAMSGGVDSTASALLLRENNSVHGFFMALAQPNLNQQQDRVQLLAEQLGIPLTIINLQSAFEKRVLNYFSGSYFEGLTPNPCVVCNKEIKFGLFLDTVLNAGMEMMATGHYANLIKEKGVCRLFQGEDPKKDQSYFLCRLKQSQLAKLHFPLGMMTKEKIYEFVESHGFGDFRGLESQDVCFLEENQIGRFLDLRSSKEKTSGNIVHINGEILGQHNGLHHYTIGQRKGLGISYTSPLYVTELNVERNEVVVGSNEALFKDKIEVKEIHWLSGVQPALDTNYTVKIRYSHQGAEATLTQTGTQTGEFLFAEPQRAVTPGQFAVIYRKKELIGSAIII